MAKKIEEMNIYEKLSAVRGEFYKAGAKKSGINTHAEFTYFELADIVPIASELFAKYHLLLLNTFEGSRADALLLNTDKDDESIVFTIPIQYIAEPAKFRMNEIQAVGSMVTYYRRYLYMVILDLVEPDTIDADRTPQTPEPKKTTTKKSATKEERKVIAEELTDADGKADELQIAALKAVLKKLRDLDPTQEEFIQGIVLKTNGFADLSKSNCEGLIKAVKAMVAEYGE